MITIPSIMSTRSCLDHRQPTNWTDKSHTLVRRALMTPNDMNARVWKWQNDCVWQQNVTMDMDKKERMVMTRMWTWSVCACIYSQIQKIRPPLGTWQDQLQLWSSMMDQIWRTIMTPEKHAQHSPQPKWRSDLGHIQISTNVPLKSPKTSSSKINTRSLKTVSLYAEDEIYTHVNTPYTLSTSRMRDRGGASFMTPYWAVIPNCKSLHWYRLASTSGASPSPWCSLDRLISDWVHNASPCSLFLKWYASRALKVTIL